MVDQLDLKSDVASRRERSSRSSRTILKYAGVFVAGEMVGIIMATIAFVTYIRMLMK